MKTRIHSPSLVRILFIIALAIPLAMGGFSRAKASFDSSEIVGWGYNGNGEFATPSGLTEVIAIAAGGFHNLALRSDGTVVAWGSNFHGQCNVPTDLSGVVAIAAGQVHSLARKSDGTVVAWGENTHGQCNVPSDLTDVVAIDAGQLHNLARKSDGTLVGWGNNGFDQTTIPAGLTDIVAFDVGYNHNLAIKTDGTVVGWGYNVFGETNIPVGLSDVVAVAAGRNHSLALKSDGTVVGWGHNTYGQTSIPSGLTDVVAIAAGGYHSLALKNDGTVVGWGENSYGQSSPPSDLSGVVAIYAGEYHSLALVQGRIYVDVDATGANDGSSWENAYTTLQPALDEATSGDQIWVAAGTYKPSYESTPGSPRTATFQLKNGVALYGGFDPSIGDTDWDDRDWTANVTILSGDLGIPGTQTDNSYHVFYHPAGLALDATATLDGFVITGGNAHTSDHLRGGGMYNEGSSPTVTNCTFVGNAAATGGGMANYDSSSPTVTNCTFSENEAAIGAGMANYNSSSPSVTHSSFLDNDSDPGNGGGMLNDHSSPTVSSCTFAGNTATSGGGIYNYVGSSPIVTNCTFVGNSATSNGGGMKNYAATAPVVTNCTFVGNSAKYYGGGIYNGYSNLTMTNCILWEDTPDEIVYDGAAPVVNYSDIQGGYVGTANIDLDPLFEDSANGDVDLLAGSPCIDAGTNAPNLPPYDFEGDPRIWDGDFDGTATADMGADEFAFHTLTLQVTGTGSGSVEQTPEGARLEHGTVVTLTAIANTGSWFTEWTGDAVGTGNPKALTMDMDKVVTATFTLASDMLTITQTADHETVSSGDPVGFTITITNTGDDTANSVTLTDTLPTFTGLNWLVGGTDGASCTITAGVLSCNFGDMPPGAVKTIRLTSPTPNASAKCFTISNTATVMAYNQPEGRSATASTEVLCPNIYMSGWANTTHVTAGDPVSLTVKVGNNGEGIARGVDLQIVLPNNPGLSWSITDVTPTSAAGNCTIDTSGTYPVLSCSFDQIAPLQEVAITITSPTTSGSCGTLLFAGGVTSSNGRAVKGSIASITINCPALLITKTADEGPFSAGDQIGFTIEVSNPYPAPAYGVTLIDTVPTIPIEWLIDQEVSPECSLDSGTWTCNVGTMAANTTYSVHIFSSSSSSTCGRVVENSASVSYSSGSSSSASDSLVVNCPDLTVTNTAASETVSSGDPIHFDITIANSGAGTAMDVALSDTLPTFTGLNWSVSGTDAASCAITAGVLSCNFGDMPPGAVRTIRLTSPTPNATATHPSCPTISNTATVMAYNQPEGRSATASVTVLCPRIWTGVWVDTPSVTAGDPISFTIHVGNIGEGIARDVLAETTLPENPGLSWSISNVVPASAAGNCYYSSGTPSYPHPEVICSFDQLAAGQEVAVTVTSPTTSASCGTLAAGGVAASSNGGQVKGKASHIIVNCTVGATVQPGEAATLTLLNGRGQIEFPADLVTVPTTFTYTEQDAPSQALGSNTFAGLSFALDATDSAGNPVTSFPASYTIRLTYQDSDWQSAGIAAENLLNLAYWDTANGQWVNVLPCEGCSLDPEQNRLVAMLNHLTEFALLASPDTTPPTTSASISPEASASGWHAGPVTVTLTASDSESGVHSTEYNLNGAGWTTYNAPFDVSSESTSNTVHNTVQYRSTDEAGNVEETKSLTIQIDTTAPTVGASVPLSGSAVQGGIKFGVNLADALSGPAGATLSIREADGASGKVIGYENMAAIFNSTSGNWELAQPFDTTQLPDGFYVLVATGKDVAGNEKTEIIPFSVRNWAVLELLPSTENNKAGRTMPVKFSLRVVQEVDPAQPFVYSEELTITIYEAGKPTPVLQSSTFGSGARDYRINAAQQTYITNFQTLKNPMQYTVEILRDALSIGTFGFQTTK